MARPTGSAFPLHHNRPHAIGVEGLLVGNEHKVIHHRLGNQHSIEWVAARPRQSARHLPDAER